MNKLYKLFSLFGVLAMFALAGCGDDDAPPPENEEEVITDITLTFTSSSEIVTATASDSDGLAPGAIVTDDIALDADTEYTLTITLLNREDPTDVEDITEEIKTEATAHQFFFSWSADGLFSNVSGTGNYEDNEEISGDSGPFGTRGGAVMYDDEETEYQTEPDEDGVAPRDNVPVGLRTLWTTGDATTSSQQFRVVLKHQPGDKTATSNSTIGESDINIKFNIAIQ